MASAEGTRSRGLPPFDQKNSMGFLDITRGREADDEQTDSDADLDAETDTEEAAGSRRWLVVLGLVAVVAVAYLVARKRTGREAEFTEIELESTAESGSESESASTE